MASGEAFPRPGTQGLIPSTVPPESSDVRLQVHWASYQRGTTACQAPPTRPPVLVAHHDCLGAAAAAWSAHRIATDQAQGLWNLAVTAEGAVATARTLTELFRQDREAIQGAGRRAGSVLRVHRALQERPVTSVSQVVELSGLSFPAAASAMAILEELGIARELTGKRRNRLYGYERYIAILNEGTELP